MTADSSATSGRDAQRAAPLRYRAADLVRFASALLSSAGLAEPLASAVAQVLVDGDLLGHSTHGLQLLKPYVGEIEQGAMRTSGEPLILSRHPATEHWDGQ